MKTEFIRLISNIKELFNAHDTYFEALYPSPVCCHTARGISHSSENAAASGWTAGITEDGVPFEAELWRSKINKNELNISFVVPELNMGHLYGGLFTDAEGQSMIAVHNCIPEDHSLWDSEDVIMAKDLAWYNGTDDWRQYLKEIRAERNRKNSGQNKKAASAKANAKAIKNESIINIKNYVFSEETPSETILTSDMTYIESVENEAEVRSYIRFLEEQELIEFTGIYLSGSAEKFCDSEGNAVIRITICLKKGRHKSAETDLRFRRFTSGIAAENISRRSSSKRKVV